MKKLFTLVLLPLLAVTANAQGLRSLVTPQTCPAGGCQPAATAQPVRAALARPVAAVTQWAAPTTDSGGWYLGKGLDRVFGADRPKLLPCRR